MNSRTARFQSRARRLTADQTALAQKVAAETIAQMGPLTKNARSTAQRGIYNARVWTAPRLDQMSKTVEKQVAPKMSAMLSATARRVEPARPRRRRWPLLAAGIIAITGCAAVAVLRIRRSQDTITTLSNAEEPATPEPQEVPPKEMAQTDSGGNGRAS